MEIKTKSSKKILTRDNGGRVNGYLVPIYNINDQFFPEGSQPQQVYLTVVMPSLIKGPHLHYIRTGCFTCIKGNARFVLKSAVGYETFYSGDRYDYKSVIVPTGIPAAIQNISGAEEAFILNLPFPAWSPTMADEHTADFSDFDWST